MIYQLRVFCHFNDFVIVGQTKGYVRQRGGMEMGRFTHTSNSSSSLSFSGKGPEHTRVRGWHVDLTENGGGLENPSQANHMLWLRSSLKPVRVFRFVQRRIGLSGLVD